MRLFQIVEVTEQFNHAGTKAVADIATVAERLGFKRINVSMDTSRPGALGKIHRQWGYYRDWNAAYGEIPKGSVVLLQHPFHHKQLTREGTLRRLKQEKEVKFISVVHDVEELRAFRFDAYYAGEFDTMIGLADSLIVHNDKMAGWFAQRGMPENKLVNLRIFDYIQDIGGKNARPASFSKSITVAGNLDTVKCGYIRDLKELPDIKVNLYGPNFDEGMRPCGNIIYNGSFPADEIPSKLNEGFGLVWDGDSIDTCTGPLGRYLRYNNPHKLSLYLSSGIPVVIWKEAAAADFVRRNGVGICVDSVRDLESELPRLGDEEYRGYVDAVRRVGELLRKGYYAENAIKKALCIIT